jgi:foldase protein PrsA
MGNFLKKNWFVLLVALIFAGISIFYIYDTNKGKLKGKNVNGEDVVYEINGEDVTASMFYDDLYKTGGKDAVLTLFQRAVADAGIETTNEIKDTAAAQAKQVIANFQNSYGSDYQTYLDSALAETGYTDLEEYLITVQKLDMVSAEYAKAHFDDLRIRQISYILVKFTDSDNVTAEPTEDEAARMKAVDDALASGTFADAAIAHSEDDSTASTGGVLGVIDKNASNLDAAFLEAALALKEGETSDWVRSENFGYFRIMCTAATAETLEANNTDVDPYLQLVQSYDTSLENNAIWAKAQELGVDFKNNADLEKEIKDALGITEASAEPEETAAPEETASPSPEETAAPEEGSESTEEGAEGGN